MSRQWDEKRVVGQLEIDAARCEAAVTPEVYATEQAYRLVAVGMPFRDAYREVSKKFSR